MKFFLLPIITCFIVSLLLTPIVKKLAFRINAVDLPNNRKVHVNIMPRLGGLSICISFLVGSLLFIPSFVNIWPFLLGGIIIMIIGIFDDVKGLTPQTKMLGQILAALIPSFSGITIDFITLPNGTIIEFGVMAIPITVFWIVAITNAINLIDGLDGLAAGVSCIATLTMSVLAFGLGHPISSLMGVILLGSTLGFLVFNFYPAKIFMGDTGSLFLGYMISLLAITGLTKSAAIFSLIIPIIVLAVPIIDTTFAIIRRLIKRQPLSSPDKLHLHHSIIRLGFSHKETVIIIYLLSSLFSLSAILFTKATIWGASVLIISLLILIEFIVEITGLISSNYRPILNLIGGSKKNSSSNKEG